MKKVGPAGFEPTDHKIKVEVVATIILLVSGALFTPRLINQFKTEVIHMVAHELPSNQKITTQRIKGK